MEPRIYQEMLRLQESHWWFIYQQVLLKNLIEKFIIVRSGRRILDAGCGTGAMLGLLQRYGWTVALDYNETALNFCLENSENILCRASISDLPFKNNSFDMINISDVLYHRNVEDDGQAIRQVYCKLKLGGLAVFHEPAFNFLKRKHDIVEHTIRRYDIKGFRTKIEAAGFKIKDIFYANNFLLPVVLILKLKEKFFEKKDRLDSDLIELPAILNRALVHFSKVENWLLMKGIRMPFGVSLVCAAVKC